MQRIVLNRILRLALACSAVVAIACSDDSGTLDPGAQTSKQNGTGGTGNDTSHGPTSNGPAASVHITPSQATVQVGHYTELGVTALDANGAPVSAKSASWRSADTNVAVAGDTGVVFGKAVGTTRVFATINGHTDSASVTVVAATSPPPPAPTLASFDLNAAIVGMVPGTDTSKTEPIAGAVVKLSRTGGVTGDTLSQPIDAGSAVSDANGAASFKGLTGGTYSVSITPPAGSPYAAITTGFAPPRSSPVQLQLKLSRKTP